MAYVKDYSEQIRGVSYKPEDVHDELDDDSIPLLRANNISDGVLNFDDLVYVSRSKVKNTQKLKAGDILICASSGSKNLVGKAAYVPIDLEMTFGAFCKVVRPKGIEATFFQHFFQSPSYRQRISDLAAGANINNIRNEHIDEMQFPLPDLPTQRCIAATLDKVSEGIAVCRQMLADLDVMVKARFVEMFGDPMLNPKGYTIKKYGELFELNAGGTPSKTVPEYWENGTISWIGSNMCQNTILYENDGKYISQAGYDHSSARIFPVDTVLIALVGATIGKTALLKFETSTNQNILGVRHIAESGYNPLFVYYYTQFLYQKFLNIGDGGFNMASKGFVSELPMYDIDIDKQNQFAQFAEQLDKSKFVVQQQLAELETLKKSLMQEYFG